MGEGAQRPSTWAVVAARMGSARMPGKSMADLAGTPAFAHIVERLKRSRFLDGVVLATTTERRDDALRECAARVRVPSFSGSVSDVLGRTLAAARSVGAELIVQVTGDCPLVDPEVVDRAIGTYLDERPDYAANTLVPTYPNGMDVEVFATDLLAEIEKLTTDAADREHVSLYIYEHPDRYRLRNVPAPPVHHWPELRLTLDTPEDHALIEAVFEHFAPREHFSLGEILAYLHGHPELVGLNRHVRQKATR